MLDWEQNIFVGLKALHRRIFIRPEERLREVVRVTLKEKRGELLLLAQMLADRPLAIFESRDAVLYREDRVFLPSEFSVAKTREGNAQLYELKAIVAALGIRDEWHRNAKSIPEILSGYVGEFPNLAKRIQDVSDVLQPEHDVIRLLGSVSGKVKKSGSGISAINLPKEPINSKVEVVTEIAGEGRADVSIANQPEDDGEGHEMPIHTFEKIETLEEYTGHSRKTDSEDELAEHEEALNALNMTNLMRTQERPRSIYRSDLILDGLSLETKDDQACVGEPYPEWDYRRRDYRKDWCFVKETIVDREDHTWVRKAEVRHSALIQRLKRQFAQLQTEQERMKRQPLGPEFDIDAIVDSETRRHTGGTPSENIYLNSHRSPHDLATLILLDESFSTDAYLNDRRVLDLITETVYCVCEVLNETIAHLAVASFSSNTRRSCRFAMVKDFHDAWPKSRHRLGSIQPQGYTRIGPALRHAQERLSNINASRKLIILVTDGRPCDYDRYEGAHGIHDIRKALETGRLHDIQTHAFAIEKRAAEYFPQMLAPRQFDIITTPDKLATTMCSLFARYLQ